MSALSTNSPSGEPLILISAGAVAMGLHLLIFIQGLTAFQEAIAAEPIPRPKETQIIATALSVSGAPTVVKAREMEPVKAEPSRPRKPASPVAKPIRTAPLAGKSIEPVARASASLTVDRLSSAVEDAAPVLPQEIVIGTTRPREAAIPEAPEVPSPTIAPSTPPTVAITPTLSQQTETVEGVSPAEPPSLTSAPTPLSVTATTPQVQAAPIADEEAAETLAPVATDRELVAETIETSTTEALALLDTDAAPVPPPLSGKESAGVASPNVPVQTVEEAQATYEDVLGLLRAYPVVDCFAALPSLSEDNEFHLETFAQSVDDLEQFRAALKEETQELPGTVMKPISQEQCNALPFITKSARYPEFQIYFDLVGREIASGTFLEGRIGNLTGGFMSLLLIDDDGVVQDLTRFLKFRPGVAEFSIPMTLQGSPVATRQLLMALSTTTRLQTLSGLSGLPADEVFNQLALEIALQGGGEDIALVAFSVD